MNLRAELLHGADLETLGRFVMLAAPVGGSAVVAPSPLIWVAVWGGVLAVVGVRRELRIRRRAAAPAVLASPQLSAAEDSARDRRGQLVRTAA